jgi:hypothetical protein
VNSSLHERVTQNPFYVLELPLAASRSEVERAGQKLLALLGVGSAAARRYRTPAGEFERTEDLVRTSLGRLRDPGERVLWELWVCQDAVDTAAATSASFEPALRLWSGSEWPRT